MVEFLQTALNKRSNYQFIKSNQALTRNTMQIKQSLMDN